MVSTAQIDAWCNQGGTSDSQRTYDHVQRALDSFTGWKAGTTREVYLQGSYKNSTNIRGDSDVDIVVEQTAAYYFDLERLPSVDREAFERDRSSTEHTFDTFRADVFAALERAFGGTVRQGNKCINVGGDGQRLNADVVPCLSYKNLVTYKSFIQYSGYFGIKFQTQKEHRWIVNYPKRHYEAGVKKNDQTGGNYKPLVRAFKNARNHMIERGWLKDGITPSYFLECFLFNVKSASFLGAKAVAFENVAKTLIAMQDAGLSGQFVCQNEIVPLFGPTPEQWNLKDAQAYTEALRVLLK